MPVSNLPLSARVAPTRPTRCASALLIAVAALTSVGSNAQAQWPDPRLGGDGDYRDLWVSHANVRVENAVGSAFPRGTAPRRLRLSFDVESNQVLVEWKRPRFIERLGQTTYQLRMKKGSSNWGRWQEVGPVTTDGANSLVVHSVDPGVTYEVQLRVRNDRIAGPPASGKVTIPASLPTS